MRYKKIMFSLIIVVFCSAASYSIYHITHAYNNEKNKNTKMNAVESQKLQQKIDAKFSKIRSEDLLPKKATLQHALKLPHKNDEQLLKFIADDNISRIDKINTVISEIEKIGVSSDQSQLFMDILSAIKPIEYAQKITSWLKIEMSEVNKIHLLGLLKNTYSIGLDATLPQSSMHALIENKKYIREKVKDYIYDANASTTSRQFALTQYGYIAPMSEVSFVIQDVLTNTIHFKDKSDRAGDLEFFIATSMLQDNAINTLMPNVLQTLNANKNNPDLALNMDNFIGKFAFFIQAKTSDKPLMDTLNPELKKIVFDFLKNNPVDGMHYDKNKESSDYGEYNKVLFKFEYGTDNWLQPFMENYSKETNANKLAGLTFALSDQKTYKELKKYNTTTATATATAKSILENERKILENKGAETAEKDSSLYWDYYAITTALTILNGT